MTQTRARYKFLTSHQDRAHTYMFNRNIIRCNYSLSRSVHIHTVIPHYRTNRISAPGGVVICTHTLILILFREGGSHMITQFICIASEIIAPLSCALHTYTNSN